MNTVLERALSRAPQSLARTLDNLLMGGQGRLSAADGAMLLRQRDPTSVALIGLAADELRGLAPCADRVTFVVNRNINFTNACVKRCGFCAFSRRGSGRRASAEEAYFLPIEEIVRRALEAQDLGATEVCLQAGLAPGLPGDFYERAAAAIRAAAPTLHIHAFSPEEVRYGAKLSGRSIPEMLRALKEAGVDSLPGTSAEILDDSLRARFRGSRLSVAQWREVVTAAHATGLPTTSTMMYGHMESPEQIAAHLELLRELQLESQQAGRAASITEFVPLSFVAKEAPIWQDVAERPADLRGGPLGREVFLVHAVSRLMLAGAIDNIQVSWPKEGLRMAQVLLGAGVNDLGGTLMNESISTAAGAVHGQLAAPSELRAVIVDAGRTPVQRRTDYSAVRSFGEQAEEGTDSDSPSAADVLEGVDVERFGSYHQLVRSADFRFSQQVSRTRACAAGPQTAASARMGARTVATAAASGARARWEPGSRHGAVPSGTLTPVTFSPSFTLVPTYECFNRCTYCNFRENIGQGAGWLSLEAAAAKLAPLRAAGVAEVLVMSGEVAPRARSRQAWVDHVVSLCQLALAEGLLPHVNVGPLSQAEFERLAGVSGSMGLMMEALTEGDRTLAVHRRAPSKVPSRRLEQLRLAGQLGVPFTTGLLLGIGETHAERVSTLAAIAEAHALHGHVQEVIIQPYTPGTWEALAASGGSERFPLQLLPEAVAEARRLLPEDVAVQVPPNLANLDEAGGDLLLACLDAGARDLGGISPIDEVNPDHRFPSVDDLASRLARRGYSLVPRAAVHRHLACRVRPGLPSEVLGEQQDRFG